MFNWRKKEEPKTAAAKEAADEARKQLKAELQKHHDTLTELFESIVPKHVEKKRMNE